MDREGAGFQRSWRDWPADPCYHPLFNYSGLPSIIDKEISSILYFALKRYLRPMSGGPVAALLHLRDSLKKSAENCGRVANVQAVYVALRPGLDCRPKKRGPVLAFYGRTSVHLSENMQLRLRSWSPPEHRARMRLETLCNTLGYLPLHLLAVPTHTLEDAVRAGNEFLQIRPGNERGSANVQQIEDEEEEEVMNPMENALTTLMKTMQQLVEKVRQLQNRSTRAAPKGEPHRKRLCWSAGKRDTPKEIASIRRRPNAPTRQFRETVKARNSRVLCCLQSGTKEKEK